MQGSAKRHLSLQLIIEHEELIQGTLNPVMLHAPGSSVIKPERTKGKQITTILVPSFRGPARSWQPSDPIWLLPFWGESAPMLSGTLQFINRTPKAKARGY